MTEIVGLIAARGGSKGIPRKNIKPLAGKPLIAWTIEAAQQSQALSRLILSTDDEEIADVGRRFGAEVPFLRPLPLAADDTLAIDVVEHALDWLAKDQDCRPDYLLLLQPTSPLRTSEDIIGAIHLAEEHNAEAVVSVCPADSHPFLIKRLTEQGTLEDFVSTDQVDLRRQALPPAYALNGAIYLNRPSSLMTHRSFLPPGTHAWEMPPERSVDIDTPWDFRLAELLLKGDHDTPID